MSIGDRLRQACKAKGLNITEFAKKNKLPYRTAQGYLLGDREPGADSLRKICTHLGVNINWLLTGEGNWFIGEDNGYKDDMDDDEQTLLSIYHESDDTGKRVIFAIVNSLKDIPEFKKTADDS